MSFINESNADRIIRVVLGVALMAVGWGGMVSGVIGTVLGVVGTLAFVTGLVGFCPAYALLKVRTKK